MELQPISHKERAFLDSMIHPIPLFPLFIGKKRPSETVTTMSSNTNREKQFHLTYSVIEGYRTILQELPFDELKETLRIKKEKIQEIL